jgi:hypothetical protein
MRFGNAMSAARRQAWLGFRAALDSLACRLHDARRAAVDAAGGA